MLFLFVAFNMVSERDNDKTLNTGLDGTRIENHTTGETVIVDARTSAVLDNLVCFLQIMPTNTFLLTRATTSSRAKRAAVKTFCLRVVANLAKPHCACAAAAKPVKHHYPFVVAGNQPIPTAHALPQTQHMNLLHPSSSILPSFV